MNSSNNHGISTSPSSRHFGTYPVPSTQDSSLASLLSRYAYSAKSSGTEPGTPANSSPNLTIGSGHDEAERLPSLEGLAALQKELRARLDGSIKVAQANLERDRTELERNSREKPKGKEKESGGRSVSPSSSPVVPLVSVPHRSTLEPNSSVSSDPGNVPGPSPPIPSSSKIPPPPIAVAPPPLESKLPIPSSTSLTASNPSTTAASTTTTTLPSKPNFRNLPGIKIKSKKQKEPTPTPPSQPPPPTAISKPTTPLPDSKNAAISDTAEPVQKGAAKDKGKEKEHKKDREATSTSTSVGPFPSPTGSRTSTPTTTVQDAKNLGSGKGSAGGVKVVLGAGGGPGSQNQKKRERERSVVSASGSAMGTPSGTGTAWVAGPVVSGPGPGAVNRIKREDSAGASSSEGDDLGFRLSKPKKSKGSDNQRKKKRKRDSQILHSDAEYSEGEGDDVPLSKVRKLDKGGTSSAGRQGSPTDSVFGGSGGGGVKIKFNLGGSVNGILKHKSDSASKKIHHPPPPTAILPGQALDFLLPSRNPIPSRPLPTFAPSRPLPKHQSEVNEDFSKQKPPNNQVPYTTFANYANEFLRAFGEDDLAFLAPKPDEIAPFLIPSLGRPYLDQWQEDDEATYAAFRSPLPSESSPPPTSSRNTTNFALQPPPLERFRPEDVNDDSSKTENVYVGPLTERLVAALALNGFSGGGGGAGGGPLALGPKETEEPAAETLLYSSGAGAVDAVELEDRVKRELRFIGVLGDEEVEWTAREDDDISSALRACQRLLRDQIAVNEGRKARLAEIVRDRIAFQEYESIRDGLERVIETGWIKRQRASKKKTKTKPGIHGAAATSLTASSSQTDSTAAGPTTQQGHPKPPPLSEGLLVALDKRRRFVDGFFPIFRGTDDEQERARFFGIPPASIYPPELGREAELRRLSQSAVNPVQGWDVDASKGDTSVEKGSEAVIS